jgi:acylphosphatase
MDKKTVFIIVTGRVQGVGFRYFIRQKANENGITGWVRNTTEGHVEIEASGSTENLGIFIDWIRTGPTRAIIRTVSVKEIFNERTFINFSIR